MSPLSSLSQLLIYHFPAFSLLLYRLSLSIAGLRLSSIVNPIALLTSTWIRQRQASSPQQPMALSLEFHLSRAQTNYRQWSFAMKFLLDGEDLWELTIDPPDDAAAQLRPSGSSSRVRTRSTRSPTVASPTGYRQAKGEESSLSIYQSCTPTPQSYIANEKDPARMWSILVNIAITYHR